MTVASPVVLKPGAVGTPAPGKKVDYRIVPFGGGVLPNVRHIARLHAELLPDSPLTKLGAGFMERFFYNVLPKQGLIFGAVAYVDCRPAGFVSATYDSDQLLRRAVRWNWLRLAWVLATSFPWPRRVEGLAEGVRIFRSREGRADSAAKYQGGGEAHGRNP